MTTFSCSDSPPPFWCLFFGISHREAPKSQQKILCIRTTSFLHPSSPRPLVSSAAKFSLSKKCGFAQLRLEPRTPSPFSLPCLFRPQSHTSIFAHNHNNALVSCFHPRPSQRVALLPLSHRNSLNTGHEKKKLQLQIPTSRRNLRQYFTSTHSNSDKITN